MTLNARAIALMLSAIIASITTAFLGLLGDISPVALIINATITFSSSYILVRVMAEFLFFREIKNIHEALDRIKDKDLSFISQTKQPRKFTNPLRRINREISTYARRKQQEIDELKRMAEFRREFIADISHELKTPIFAAQGFVHTLLDGAVEDKKVRGKFLKKAAKSLDGLNILVQNLLTISQMEIGEITMHYESFDIVNMCHEVLDQLEGKAEKKDIRIKFEGTYPEPIYVNADYHRIYQVITNLLVNGINYTRKNGKVRIRIDKLETGVKVSVTDNGKGIPPEDINRIFERFYRVDKSRSKEKGGTGLGLSIVKHIMEGHNSSIQVESTPKKGSTFWFLLEHGDPQKQIVWDDEE